MKDRTGQMEAAGKPLTPFSIEDILSKPSVKKPLSCLGPPSQHRLPGGGARPGGLLQSSPLCALEQLASKTFPGPELTGLRAAEGQDPLGPCGHGHSTRKRRKSRTAFTNQQIYELEKRFVYQKYLAPADRDHVAQQLGLSNAQVITWFQNRRAKLKRDLEEMRADVESLNKLPPQALERLVLAGASREAYAQPPRHAPAEHTPGAFSDDEEIDVDD